MSEAKKLSQDNAFVSDLVLRQHVCPSRDNQNDQRQQKRQPTAVDPAEGKLRKITTQVLRHRLSEHAGRLGAGGPGRGLGKFRWTGNPDL